MFGRVQKTPLNLLLQTKKFVVFDSSTMSFVCYTVDFINIKHMLPAISLRLLAPIYGVFCCIRTSELSISLFNESVTAQGPTKET